MHFYVISAWLEIMSLKSDQLKSLLSLYFAEVAG